MAEEFTELRKLQIAQLSILLEIKRICEKHQISYSLIAGTMLGAVRHQGFIPWDDDIDVGMLRSDYIKFLNVCKLELQDQFFLQTRETDINYGGSFAKIRINNTICKFKGTEHLDIHHGIWVDIFPYDNAPNNIIAKTLHKYVLRWLYAAVFEKYNYFPDKGKIHYVIYKISALPFLTWEKCKVMELLERVEQYYYSENTDNVVLSASSYSYNKEYFPKKILDELIDVEFEKYMFPIVSAYDARLSKIYGDYMRLPPVEKRNKNIEFITELDLGVYQNEEMLLKSISAENIE